MRIDEDKYVVNSGKIVGWVAFLMLLVIFYPVSCAPRPRYIEGSTQVNLAKEVAEERKEQQDEE